MVRVLLEHLREHQTASQKESEASSCPCAKPLTTADLSVLLCWRRRENTNDTRWFLRCLQSWSITTLYQFPKAAVTKQHRVSAETIETFFFSVLEARSLNRRCGQGWFLLGAVREGPVLGLPPWFVDGHLLPMSSRCLPSVSVCVQMSPSYKDNSHTGLGPNLITSF